MNLKDAKAEVKAHWRELLPTFTATAKTPVNGEPSFICPICGHGEHGDGLTRNTKSDTDGLICFGCGFSGDIISLYQQSTNVGFKDAIIFLSGKIGIDIDSAAARSATSSKAAYADGQPSRNREPKNAPKQEPPKQTKRGADYSAYYKACMQNLAAQAPQEGKAAGAAWTYIQKRGIDPRHAIKYGVGFDPAADPANAAGGDGQKKHPTPRLITPTSKSHYVGRRIDGITEYDKINNKGGEADIFNVAALYDDSPEPIFITEGIFDALSVIEAGGNAIALNSASNAGKLVERLKGKPTGKALVLLLDNDEAGKNATEKLKEALNELQALYLTAAISGDLDDPKAPKDPNAALLRDRIEFIKIIENAAAEAAEITRKPDNIADYVLSPDGMDADIVKYSRCTPTGFSNLDTRSGGGIFGGLYVLAATSSLGKTTFIHQVADNMAAAGTDVIFFSLEQTRLELVAKSISRTLAIKNKNSRVNNLGIRLGARSIDIMNAKQEYAAKIGDRLSIIQSSFDCTPEYIETYIKAYILRTKTRPVVIIDYLQAIQPDPNKKGFSKKDDLDNIVIALKKISGSLNVPIIAISSVNRANYLTPIDFEAIKESGGIEYTADVVWGLQLQCLNDELFFKDKNIVEKRETIKKAKKEIPRRVQLVCLKNRFGISNYDCFFEYYSDVDLFEMDSAAETESDPDFEPIDGAQFPF